MNTGDDAPDLERRFTVTISSKGMRAFRANNFALSSHSKVTLEPSTFTDEKFKLYCAYQAHAHGEHEKQPGGFTRFLVNSPLIVSAGDAQYGIRRTVPTSSPSGVRDLIPILNLESGHTLRHAPSGPFANILRVVPSDV